MIQKTYVPSGEEVPASQIGATLEALAATIAARREAGDESYTHRLLTSSVDVVLKKVMEESGEVALAAKDVESWACSSLASSLACGQCLGSDAAALTNVMAASDGVAASEAVTGTSAAKAFGTAAGVCADSLTIDLPAEYGEAIDHLRYEAADVVYHLLVVLERYGIGLDEFAAELNNRMAEGERPQGAVRLFDEYVRRGK